MSRSYRVVSSLVFFLNSVEGLRIKIAWINLGGERNFDSAVRLVFLETSRWSIGCLLFFFFFKSFDNVPLSTVKLRLTRCVSLIYLVKSFASHGVIWVLEQSVKYQLSTGFRNLQSSRIPVLLKLIRGFSVLFDSLLVCRIIYRKRKKKKKTRISNIFKHECDQKSIIFPNINTFLSHYN